MTREMLNKDWKPAGSFEPNAIKRLAMYSRPTPDGGVSVDYRAMTEDLIAVYKLGGFSRASLGVSIDALWPTVKVAAAIPRTHRTNPSDERKTTDE